MAEQVPGPAPHGLRRDRHVDSPRGSTWLRRGGMVVFAAIAIAALFSVFGQRPTTSTASTPEATLSVRVPPRLRGGLVYQARIRIDAHRAIPHARVLLARDWVEGITLNSFEPSASTEGEQAGKLEFDLGALKPGDSEVLYLQLSVNPTTVGSRSQDVELDDGVRPIARIHRTLTVFP